MSGAQHIQGAAKTAAEGAEPATDDAASAIAKSAGQTADATKQLGEVRPLPQCAMLVPRQMCWMAAHTAYKSACSVAALLHGTQALGAGEHHRC